MILRICRLCLASNVKMFSLNNNLLKWCLKFIPILNESSSRFPSYACYECAAILIKFSKLLERSLKSQSVLINLTDVDYEISETLLSTINRQELGLNSSLKSDLIQPNSIIEYTYNEDEVIKTKQEENQLAEVVGPKSEVNDEGYAFDDSNGFDTDDESPIVTLAKPKFIKVVCEPLKNLDKTIDTHSNKIKKTTQTKSKPTVKRKQVKMTFSDKRKRSETDKSILKDANKETSSKRKASRLDEKILKCFEVIKLSRDEQMKDLEQRKSSPFYTKALYKCELCYKGFKKLDPYNNHMAEHEPSYGAHECPVCKKRFQQRTIFVRHVASNHEKRFQCRLCPLVCKERQTHVHMGSHEGMTYTFRCKHCTFETDNATRYYSHRRTHASRHDCLRCGRAFISERGLALHVKRAHRGTQTEAEGEHPCTDCQLTFETKAALDIHLLTSRRHTDTSHILKSKVCVTCGEVVASAAALARHVRENHAPADPFPKQCEHCEEMISSSWQHWQHTRSKHPEQKQNYRSQAHQALCEVCGRGFKCAIELRNHSLRHSAGRVLTCPAAPCTRTFYDTYQLRLHVRNVHAQRAAHGCALCGRQFKVKGNLNRHMLVHSGARPHACSVCGARFTQGGSRDLHERTVHYRQPHPPRRRRRRQPLAS